MSNHLTMRASGVMTRTSTVIQNGDGCQYINFTIELNDEFTAWAESYGIKYTTVVEHLPPERTALPVGGLVAYIVSCDRKCLMITFENEPDAMMAKLTWL